MKVALAHGSASVAATIRLALEHGGRHRLAWLVHDGDNAVQRCLVAPPELLLLDLRLPRHGAEAVVREVMASAPCPILLLAGDVNAALKEVFPALAAGALDAVDTPAPDGARLLHKIDGLARRLGHAAVATASAHGVGRGGLAAVGGSAGGPGALCRLLEALSPRLNATLLVTQHIDGAFIADLVAWLGRHSPLPVRLAADGDAITPGQVLVAADGRHLVLGGDGRLHYRAGSIDELYKPSVDALMHSVCEHWHGLSAGVLLSGMGRDGVTGLLRMRERGALTLAQDERSCAVFGMPLAAWRSGAVSELLRPAIIGQRLARHFGEQPELQIAK